MSDREPKIIFYVSSPWRARLIQARFDPAILVVRVVGGGTQSDRASSVIIEVPEFNDSVVLRTDFERWVQDVPMTRLMPGCQDNVTYVR